MQNAIDETKTGTILKVCPGKDLLFAVQVVTKVIRYGNVNFVKHDYKDKLIVKKQNRELKLINDNSTFHYLVRGFVIKI